MKFTLPTILALAGLAAATPLEIRTLTTSHGTILAPSPSSLVSPSTTFPFNYSQSNWCHDGYSQVQVFLTDYAVTAANVNAGTGVVAPVVHAFGTFTAANFGLPPLSSALPSSLALPDLAPKGVTTGATLYVTVVERAANCPPGGVPAQFGFTSVPVAYA